MRFFQQRLQLILQTDSVPRPLIPCACQCPPQTLFSIRHKAQTQCARAVRDWTTLAPDGVFLTSSRHLPDFDSSVASTVPVRSTAVSSIGQWTPSPLPPPAAPPATR